MRKFAVCILAGILLSTSVVSYSKDLSEEMSEGIVRLHIIADSNDYEDQAVKLKIRDEILNEMKKHECDDIEDSVALFEKIANQVLDYEGFGYEAKTEFGRFEFPTKHYDNFSLPKGEYNAVRVRLGKAEGENWWCVLFPPLCMIDAATEESELLLKETFGENYDVITCEKPQFNIKFKLAEMF